jgi:hypothetical protein
MEVFALDLTWLDIKKQNQIASEWILYYHQRSQLYTKMQNNISALSATQYTGMPHGSGKSDSTVQKVIELEKLKNDELWLITIEDIEKIVSPQKKVFIEVRRRAEEFKNDGIATVGRPGWVSYTQATYADKIYRMYGYEQVPSERTMMSWWNQVVDLAVRVAIKRGCL